MGVAIVQKNKFFLVFAALLITVTYFYLSKPKAPDQSLGPAPLSDIHLRPEGVDQKKIAEWIIQRNSMKNLSKLGEVLFLDSPEPEIPDSDKRYQILVWKYGPTIENRHLKHFSGKRIDPFEYCPVKNCDITYNESDLETADIVIFHLHRMKGVSDMPNQRDSKQIWAFLTDESPYNTFLSSWSKLKDFNNLFNWSMSYRSDSDIPVPYGRTILKKTPGSGQNLQLFLNKRRDVLVAVLGSNCGGRNKRWDYVKKLQEHMQVHVYGGCGPFKKECPGHFGADCPAINDYLFYLSFENSNCDEYITEKLWWNAYQKNSIPVVMGSSKETYKRLLPVDSYINVDDFASPKDLAEQLQRLVDTGEFQDYYRWRNNFEVLNEHGYFQSKSYHYCRICQALSYNERNGKVYDDLESYWNVHKDCHPAWNAWVEP